MGFRDNRKKEEEMRSNVVHTNRRIDISHLVFFSWINHTLSHTSFILVQLVVLLCVNEVTNIHFDVV